MNRSDFLGLAPATQMRLLLTYLEMTDAPFGSWLDGQEKPRVVFSPKFDARVTRKGGFTWASEMSLSDLVFWADLKRKQAAEGGQYAEKNQKTAEQLERWLAWREQNPASPWTGTRGDEQLTVPAPSGKPTLHEWEARGERRLDVGRAQREPGDEDDDPTAGWAAPMHPADDDVPFG